jgi:hypothetical protein
VPLYRFFAHLTGTQKLSDDKTELSFGQSISLVCPTNVINFRDSLLYYTQAYSNPAALSSEDAALSPINPSSTIEEIFSSNVSSIGTTGPIQTYPELEPEPIRKFGEEPTNRVLPVDLTDEDYEDEDPETENELGDLDSSLDVKKQSDYCARVLRTDLLRVSAYLNNVP